MSNSNQKSTTMSIVRKHDIKAQKKYGQNFLTDDGVLDEIVEAAGVCDRDHIVEIGPGLGALTKRLAEKASHVTAIEIDSQMIPVLDEVLEGFDNTRVICADVLKTDMKEIADTYPGEDVKIVANLPYYITTPIVTSLLESGIHYRSITVMVQTEVAERMQTGPGSKDYGALSLAVQYYSKPEIMIDVPPECFYPMPGVGSSVIKLDLYEEPPVKVSDPAFMFRIIKASFMQRRKTLQNALQNNPDTRISREKTSGALEKLGLDPLIRGEALTLEQFAALSDLLV
ncbi:MAG: 16S rRNA (adenine(1518)-N(6)/adenine(1519)-N(6))-dimethyltransferase RsmA [Lachnospiraceae bacterium]|nr:16S rRNA (adenine(1518)-N(6)/adenine(1519)-N(6))-dimethyltransferase RsmA [Clostridiales bacterium]MBP3753305.1 16S rRNA (adenine(1518)-N(6)/adenine(1519)-N(6))-dimethyltransferase RsmA [Lachnospiraceae bacterium]